MYNYQGITSQSKN